MCKNSFGWIHILSSHPHPPPPIPSDGVEQCSWGNYTPFINCTSNNILILWWGYWHSQKRRTRGMTLYPCGWESVCVYLSASLFRVKLQPPRVRYLLAGDGQFLKVLQLWRCGCSKSLDDLFASVIPDCSWVYLCTLWEWVQKTIQLPWCSLWKPWSELNWNLIWEDHSPWRYAFSSPPNPSPEGDHF